MNADQFRKYGHEVIDWMASYFKNIEKFSVKSEVSPGQIIAQLPELPPEKAEDFGEIMDDFEKIILPGIMHWQHPGFHAYFTANNSYPSILAEMLTAALSAQCMSWQTSPSATELEERVMQWLAQMIGLPDFFTGVIQDTASTSTLVSVLTARELATDYRINTHGFDGKERFTVYCSVEAHSSIERAVKIAGFGSENLHKIEVNDVFAMKMDSLEQAIVQDLTAGMKPLMVIAAIGTTGSTAVDPLEEIGKICKKYKLWLHVDAAWAGTALLLPEMRYLIKGIENVDSLVFNPHKWMFTNFDCSAYFVKNKSALIRTFEILPEYLKTNEIEKINNYRDWGIQLGRRFRALKLWFVIRSFGIEGLREKIRNHISWAKIFAEWVEKDDRFELMAPADLAVVCFRLKLSDLTHIEDVNRKNAELLERINHSGKVFLSHTKLDGKYTLRFVVGQTNTEFRHIQNAWQIILESAIQMI